MSFEAAIQPLLDCMCSALAEAGWEGSCCLVPGTAALDSCCEGGGEAWGQLVRAYPSSDFPSPDAGTTSECDGATRWALQVELGASVCVCDDLCDCGVKAANASVVMATAEAALQGVLCCLSGEGPCAGTEFTLTGIDIHGPSGGCSHFTIDLIIQYFMVCCPTE